MKQKLAITEHFDKIQRGRGHNPAGRGKETRYRVKWSLHPEHWDPSTKVDDKARELISHGLAGVFTHLDATKLKAYMIGVRASLPGRYGESAVEAEFGAKSPIEWAFSAPLLAIDIPRIFREATAADARAFDIYHAGNHTFITVACMELASRHGLEWSGCALSQRDIERIEVRSESLWFQPRVGGEWLWYLSYMGKSASELLAELDEAVARKHTIKVSAMK